jgi:biotin transport system substrate-specific component
MRRTLGTTRLARFVAIAVDGSSGRVLVVRPVLAKVALVAAGVGVMTAGAWVSAPFYPVPMTMQTLAVLLVGGLLGPKLGAAAVAGYLALGLTGAPVFHNGLGGPAVMAGPTGGYLVGFLAAAFLMGLFARRAQVRTSGRKGLLRGLAPLAVGAVLAEVAIYALGVPWLALFVGLDLGQALAAGVVPFILGDLLKMAVAIGAVRGGRSLLARWGSLPL